MADPQELHDLSHGLGRIDRYVAGELASEEQARFEEHLFDCPDCFAEVQAAESFRDSLRGAAAEDAARATALGLAGWLARQRSGTQRTLWVALCLALLLLPGFLLWRQARLEHALAAAAAPRAEEQRLLTERDRLAADLARERQAHEALAGRLAAATSTPAMTATPAIIAAPTLLVPLGLVREGTGEPSAIHLGRQPAWIVLSLEPPGGPAACRVTLLDAEGRTLWRGDRVEPSLYDTLLVTVPSSLLPPGRYRVRLEPLTPIGPPGKASKAGDIPFRVLPAEVPALGSSPR